MKLTIADTFQRSLAKLDNKDAALVKQAAFDFQLNPDSPGFNFHPLKHAKDQRFCSFRVNDDIRIIVHRSQNNLVLCYAAHHDAAYAWGESRRIEAHPQTGAAQIVEVIERVEEVVRKVEKEPPLFDSLEPDYLLALGVPSEWLDAVKIVTEGSLDSLMGHLPQEAAERLFRLACGEPVPRPAAMTVANPFDHPDALRRFRVMDDQDELRRALDCPWEQWLVFLHPTQRRVAEGAFQGAARVAGSAGTGKTVVAMHRAARLAAGKGSKPVLLTTFSKTLAARLGQQADLLVKPEAPQRQRIHIEHIHRVAHNLWSKATGKSFTPANGKAVNDALEAAKSEVGAKADASLQFLRSEWDAIIDPWNIRSWPSYRAVSRAGRATPLGAKQRREYWRVFERAQLILAERGLMTWSQLCYEAADSLGAERPYAHVIADECQDFGPAELTFLRSLVEPCKNDLFLCGDAGQRIFKGRFSWMAVGIDVRGRSTRLKVNYRTTDQIRKFADGLMPDQIDEGDDGDPARATISLLNGPSPEVKGYGTLSEEVAGAAEWIQGLLKAGFAPRDIAIFGRTEAVIKDRAMPALARIGLTGHALSDETPPSTTDVSIGTMHRAKGLEFRIVLVMGCDKALLPLAHAMKDIADEADREAFVEQERQLLYVACTRARERVMVSFTGKGSEYLG